MTGEPFGAPALTGLARVELHLHLDCCLSFAAARQLDPHITLEDYRHGFVAPRR